MTLSVAQIDFYRKSIQLHNNQPLRDLCDEVMDTIFIARNGPRDDTQDSAQLRYGPKGFLRRIPIYNAGADRYYRVNSTVEGYELLEVRRPTDGAIVTLLDEFPQITIAEIIGKIKTDVRGQKRRMRNEIKSETRRLELLANKMREAREVLRR